jgi:hypothetical protein
MKRVGVGWGGILGRCKCFLRKGRRAPPPPSFRIGAREASCQCVCPARAGAVKDRKADGEGRGSHRCSQRRDREHRHRRCGGRGRKTGEPRVRRFNATAAAVPCGHRFTDSPQNNVALHLAPPIIFYSLKGSQCMQRMCISMPAEMISTKL